MKIAGLAVFDMDGTLLDGRVVFALARSYGVEKEVMRIQATGLPGYQKTKEIALQFAGIPKENFRGAAESIPLAKNCEAVISRLKSIGFKTGIISDSYTVTADRIAEILGMDFVAANRLEFVNGKATGNITMPMGWEKIDCDCRLSVCKRYHTEKLAREIGVTLGQTLAVGDTESDVCMVQRAGLGLAFMPKDKVLPRFARYVINSGNFADILPYVKALMPKPS